MDHTESYFNFYIDFKRQYAEQLTSTYFQTFLLWLLCYLTLFIPIPNFNERFMGSVTALLVLAALLGNLEKSLPKSSQLSFIDFWFIWYILNIFVIILFHVVIEKLVNIRCFEKFTSKIQLKDFINKIAICTFAAIIFLFNCFYFLMSIRHSYS